MSAIGWPVIGIVREISIALFRIPQQFVTNPTLVLNGYNLVPSSPETVTSFYGVWTYFPGAPTITQGQQQFDLVDPATNENTGTFDALISTGSPINLGSDYTELLVTANDGTNVGTGSGQVPPVGSIISSQLFGPSRKWGWSYSDMPTESGDLISFKLVTPFGDIPIPMSFDAAAGIADHTVDNRPVDLGNGYYIAPADPTGETFTGTSGILPFTTVVQGYQTFNIYDSDGNAVGSFDGNFTTTKDIAGAYTQAIVVTANDGINVGTNAGQVPPVGSVYNVIYNGSDDNNVIYSSLPSPDGNDGDVVSVLEIKGDKVSNIRTFPLNILNASSPPPVEPVPAPGGYSFYPTSSVVPSGVNGLPPREMESQGYQQFGLYDPDGIQQGSFDADTYSQWDLNGWYSYAFLVTNVTDGTAGTDTGDVPPVGSTFQYVYYRNSGFGTLYSVMPSPSGDVTSFKLITPLGNIPIGTTYNAVATLTGADFYDPF